jgi:hypothetical protein
MTKDEENAERLSAYELGVKNTKNKVIRKAKKEERAKVIAEIKVEVEKIMFRNFACLDEKCKDPLCIFAKELIKVFEE